MRRIQVILVQVSPAHQDVEIVVPAVSQIVQKDGGIDFIEYGIEVALSLAVVSSV